MERSGIIDRRADPADRRTTRISLTDAGSATLADLKEALRDLNSQITAGFTAEELGAIARWLEQVAALRR
jgi:DNA-binding MarR family transcriptional regulator